MQRPEQLTRAEGRLAETAYRRLRDGILRGELPPRSVLDQRRLAARLASSRTPVRQALGRLLQEGLVETGARRQLVVRDFTPSHRREILLLREALETVSVRQACAVLGDDDLDQLRLILIQQRRAARSGRDEEFLDLDERFHLRIAERAQLPILHSFLGQLGGFVRVATRGVARPPAVLENVVDEHERLVEAIERRDTAAAVEALADHLSRRSTSAAEPLGHRREALR